MSRQRLRSTPFIGGTRSGWHSRASPDGAAGALSRRCSAPLRAIANRRGRLRVRVRDGRGKTKPRLVALTNRPAKLVYLPDGRDARSLLANSLDGVEAKTNGDEHEPENGTDRRKGRAGAGLSLRYYSENFLCASGMLSLFESRQRPP
jgi:hypothetical protein